jgi:hypothetical protein
VAIKTVINATFRNPFLRNFDKLQTWQFHEKQCLQLEEWFL